VHTIPNWLHASLAAEIAALPGKLDRPPGRPVRLLYSGNIGTKQDLVGFCSTLRQSDAAFEFRIQGGGGMAPAVRDWVEAAGDPRFTFHNLTDEAGAGPVFRWAAAHEVGSMLANLPDRPGVFLSGRNMRCAAQRSTIAAPSWTGTPTS
jgi:hypothetical protein